jgi:heat shock protein HslJ
MRHAPRGIVVATVSALAGCTGAAGPTGSQPPSTAAAPSAAQSPAPPDRPLAFDATIDCGDRIATLGSTGQRWVLRVDGREIALEQAPAASGARWHGAVESAVEVWNRGDRTRLALPGSPPVECRTSAPAGGTSDRATSFAARGNEPAWRLEVAPQRLRWAVGIEPDPVVLATAAATPAGSGRRWTATLQGRPFTVTALDRVCADSMSGMPHPMEVTVRHGDATFRGCGGRPSSLLTGPEWVVEDIDRRGIIDRSRVTLNFREDGRLDGRAGCDTYTARWQLDGESLRIVDVAPSGARACAAALAGQDGRFLARLATVTGFAIDETRGLLLTDGRGGSLLARD